MLDRKSRQIIKWLITEMVFIASAFAVLVFLAASANAASRTGLFPEATTLRTLHQRESPSTMVGASDLCVQLRESSRNTFVIDRL